VKYAWVKAHSGRYPVARRCRVLAVSRTGFIQWRDRPPSERHLANAALDAEVAALHAQSRQSYGRVRIVRGLRAQGRKIGHERVRRSLCRQGLRPVYTRPYRVTTDAGHQQPAAPDLLARRFDGWQPDLRLGRGHHLYPYG
jgi:putative transposase